MPKPPLFVQSVQYNTGLRRTDGRTDGRTRDDSIYRASIASRVKQKTDGVYFLVHSVRVNNNKKPDRRNRFRWDVPLAAD